MIKLTQYNRCVIGDSLKWTPKKKICNGSVGPFPSLYPSISAEIRRPCARIVHRTEEGTGGKIGLSLNFSTRGREKDKEVGEGEKASAVEMVLVVPPPQRFGNAA